MQRGVGEGAIGSSLSLVAPAEDKAHAKIQDAVQATFLSVSMDGRLLSAAQERTNLAAKIVTADEIRQRTQSRNKWFQDKATEAELEVDDDVLEDESNLPMKELVFLKEAEKAKSKLANLLAEPIKTQRFGKFLSTNSAAGHAGVAPVIVKSKK